MEFVVAEPGFVVAESMQEQMLERDIAMQETILLEEEMLATGYGAVPVVVAPQPVVVGPSPVVVGTSSYGRPAYQPGVPTYQPGVARPAAGYNPYAAATNAAIVNAEVMQLELQRERQLEQEQMIANEMLVADVMATQQPFFY